MLHLNMFIIIFAHLLMFQIQFHTHTGIFKKKPPLRSLFVRGELVRNLHLKIGAKSSFSQFIYDNYS